MPKGFLPLQDTGLITAVTEAGTDVSFAEMQRLQRAVEDAIRADPDVTGVVSVVGVSPLNPTPNAGRLTITLKPRDERASLRRAPSSTRLKQRGRRHPRHDGLFPAGAGHPDLAPAPAARSTSTRWSAPTRDEVIEWADKLAARAAATRRRCATSPPRRRKAACAPAVEVDREKAGRLGVSMQAINDTLNDAFGQRQISTIYAQANQYRVILEAQPRYQQDPAALSKIYVTGASTSTGTVADRRQHARRHDQHQRHRRAQRGHRLEPGAARGLRALRCRITAPLAIAHQEQFPSVTISFNLAPGCCAERRGRRHQPRRSARSACRRR